METITQRSAAPAANLQIRSVLMARLRDMIAARRLTQVEAARWFNVSQSRVSHLVHDRTNRFTTDTLINMFAHAGGRVSVEFDDPGARHERRHESGAAADIEVGADCADSRSRPPGRCDICGKRDRSRAPDRTKSPPIRSHR